jgi:hypothetical protein
MNPDTAKKNTTMWTSDADTLRAIKGTLVYRIKNAVGEFNAEDAKKWAEILSILSTVQE